MHGKRLFSGFRARYLGSGTSGLGATIGHQLATKAPPNPESWKSTDLNNVEGSINQCTGQLEYANYNYNVHAWTCYLIVILFALSSLAHLFQAIKSKRYFLLWTILLCGIGETIGWAGRLWSATSTEWSPELGGYWASADTAFLMQIASFISPAFLSAAWYILLGRLIQYLGPQYCRLTTRTYLILFVTGDVASLVVQAIGGGMAASANTTQGSENGAHIMVAGVIVQMVIMIFYSILLVDVVVHYVQDRPVRRQIGFGGRKQATAVAKGARPRAMVRKCEILVAAMVFSTILVFIRSVYRTIELLNGWHGPIISDEKLFVVLDGLMIFLATAIFNVIHPMWYLPTDDSSSRYGDSLDGINLRDGKTFDKDTNGHSIA